jgi:ribosome-binding factor A
MTTHRQEKVSGQIHQEIMHLLQIRIRDPRLLDVTVTGVEITPDLKSARVYITRLGDRQAGLEALQGIQHAAAFIRRELAQHLQMRHMPELSFELDESWLRGARIDELLEGLPPPAPDSEDAEAGDDGGDSVDEHV